MKRCIDFGFDFSSSSSSPLSCQCYYIGATSDAATKIINEVSKPLSYHVPVEKICEKLKKKDGQICELKYGEEEEEVAPRLGSHNTL